MTDAPTTDQTRYHFDAPIGGFGKADRETRLRCIEAAVRLTDGSPANERAAAALILARVLGEFAISGTTTDLSVSGRHVLAPFGRPKFS